MKSKNSEQPLVSVIMPTYNHAKFIGKAVESVLSQTYQNFELIIINNYSEDDTEKIVASYKDDRIIYLKFRNNGIIAASRNYGIKHSHGEYIAFLDSDDFWHRQKLEKQLPHFVDEQIVGVATDAVIKGNETCRHELFFGKSKLGYKDYVYNNIFTNNPIITSSLIIRKNILVSADYFDERKEFQFIEDMDLWLRMARAGKFRVLGEKLISYTALNDKFRDRVKVVKRNANIIKKHFDLGYVGKAEIVERESLINYAIGLNLLRLGDSGCREYFIDCIKKTSILRLKLKAYGGCIISFFPMFFIRTLLYLYYASRRISSAFGQDRSGY